MRIANAQHMFNIRDAETLHQWTLKQAQSRIRQVGISSRRIGRPESPDLNAPQAVAYVNHGRWVADCPSPHCKNAMVLLPGAPFLCAVCLNADIGYQYRLIAWPEGRGAIEMLLAERNIPETQNWYPGEPIEQLATENRAMRDGVLK